MSFERLSLSLKRDPALAGALGQLEASRTLLRLAQSAVPPMQRAAITGCSMERDVAVVLVRSHADAMRIHASQTQILAKIQPQCAECTTIRVRVQANVISQKVERRRPNVPSSAATALRDASARTQSTRLRATLERLAALATGPENQPETPPGS